MQQRLAGFIRSGTTVVDATLGNGHDALFLAQTISPGGWLFGFDRQAIAVNNSRQRLQRAERSVRTALFCDCHSTISRRLPTRFHGRVGAILFNLGYLPGGERGITTQSETTLSALQQSTSLLATDGVLSIIVYPGHSSGREELEAISTWVRQLPPIFSWEQQSADCLHPRSPPPEWFIITRGGL
ncbi:MAG: class I SAM-dependent methyltransferase [Gammaproteobacteria bacterium]|nr:class I SAM-dependent methyltransferase [Gammaproteobacteria bacterium]